VLTYWTPLLSKTVTHSGITNAHRDIRNAPFLGVVMNKSTIKAFIAWLETASQEQITEKKKEIDIAFDKVTSREGKADLRLCLRLIDEEIIARLELSKSGDQ
jgi:hypothetical protein